jgi:hypothetical protein
MTIDRYKDFLSNHFSEETTFTEVANFTDFIKTFLNKSFMLIRDIAQA